MELVGLVVTSVIVVCIVREIIKWMFVSASWEDWNKLTHIVDDSVKLQTKMLETQKQLKASVTKIEKKLTSVVLEEMTNATDKNNNIAAHCSATSTVPQIQELNDDTALSNVANTNNESDTINVSSQGKDNESVIDNKRNTMGSNSSGNNNKSSSSSSIKSKDAALYETESLCNQYMEFHYTPSAQSFAYHDKFKYIHEVYDFHARLITKFTRYKSQKKANASSSSLSSFSSSTQTISPTMAIDVGCATGGSTFALSTEFDKVIGVDLSRNFINLAQLVQQQWMNRKTSNSSNPEKSNNNNNNDDKDNTDVNDTTITISKETTATSSASLKEGITSSTIMNVAFTPWHYKAPVQGEIKEHRVCCPLNGQHPEHCEFHVADCLSLLSDEDTTEIKEAELNTKNDGRLWKMKRAEATNLFDGVLCMNLLDRVPDPQLLLDTCVTLTKPETGVFVLCDPYSWSESVTPKDKWMGGCFINNTVDVYTDSTKNIEPTDHVENKNNDTENKDDNNTNNSATVSTTVKSGTMIRSEDAVKAYLTSTCELLEESDEPFLIRDHIRHYQIGVAHCTVWRRKKS